MRFLPSKNAIAAAAKYISLGAGVFAVGLVWNFPYERIKETLTKTITKKSGYRFDMEKLSPSLPLGFRAENAQIQGPPIAGQAVDLKFQSLTVGVTVPSVLLYPFRKSLTVTFLAEQDGNSWSGTLAQSKETTFVELKTKGLKLDRDISMEAIFPMLGNVPIRFRGKTDLALSLSASRDAVMRGDLSAADGKISFAATQGAIDAKIAKELRFDKLSLTGALEKGKVDVKSIQLSGDISGTASGTIQVEPFFSRSQLQLQAKLNLSQATELRTLITTYGSAMGLRVGEDGTLAFKLAGMAGSPRISGY